METDVKIDAGWPVYAVLGVSIGVDFIRSRQLGAIATEELSDALAADALHFASDLVSSVLALIGIAATQFGFLKGDALASFGVAIFIAIAGYRLGQRTISTLLDAAPGDLTPQIRQAITDVPGVITLDDLPAEVRVPQESLVVGQQSVAGIAGAGVGLVREAGLDRGSVPGVVAKGTQGTQPFRLEDLEKAHIVEILRQQNGNKARAARVLGIHRRKLYRLLERHGLHEERPIS